MSHWVLLVAPLVLASFVMLVAFVGCGLNAEGEEHGKPTEPDTTRDQYKDVVGEHPNLVGYWRLGEATGDPKAADSSMKGNDGKYVGTVTLQQPGLVVGDSDTAAQFDGSGHVELPFVLDPAGAFTIECLVKADALGGLPTIVSQLDGAGTGRSLLFVDASSHFASNLGGTPLDSAFTAVVDKVHHVAFTSAGGAGGAWAFYVDGAETASGTATGDSADGGWLIGVNKVLAAPWSGIIDEVAVYDAVLEAARIQTHFTLATTGPTP